MLRSSLALSFACLLACSGARETDERPAASPVRSSASAAPLPSTAFHSDEEIPSSLAALGRSGLVGPSDSPCSSEGPRILSAQDGERAPISRFETRRIGAATEEGRPRYHGATVDLDLKNADLADVFRLLADVGHVNIVVDGDVHGTITLRLRHVPWDQALDVIAKAKGLALEREGNVTTVRPAILARP